MADHTDAEGSDLSGGIQMLNELRNTLKQLEEAQGGCDEDARRALAHLEAKMKEVSASQAARERAAHALLQPAPTDVEIATNIDRLEEQLTHFEHKVASVDQDTQKLMGHSTQLWLKRKAGGAG